MMETQLIDIRTEEEQRVAHRAVERYRADNHRKRENLQAAADAFFHAAANLQTVWQECCDETGDAFDGYPSNWPSFDELVAQAGHLQVRAGYEFGES
jgi:hypothetical protein